MNAPTDTQQASNPDQPEATPRRRFRGRQRTLVIAGAAGVLLLGGGAAAAFAADEIDDRDDRAEQAADDANGSDDRYDDDRDGTDDDDFVLPAEAIGEDAAVEAALAEVAGEVYDVDLEGTAEAPVWVVEVTDADGADWDVAVNALDGKVTDVFADDDANDDDGDDDNDGTDDDNDNDDNDADDRDDNDND
ncbi:PepSY domain-containing protein [Glycomyces tritici]|uniref:PepSY domain-containing protein n=1 Tax=Glycomyces tritici TaxID=2665176 RepID=A0ABT7YK35_9ACTN|nr:PepSY domain-containing protein [Glycomyces tritici]MDN3238952.1 PepSY domain-containing protein [Glycomyces tritici]